MIGGKDKNSPDPGRVLYCGTAYPDAIRFFNPSNKTDSGDDLTPDAIFSGMSARPAAEWRKTYRQSVQHREYVAERAGTHPAKNKRIERQRRRNVPLLSQWKTLVARCLAIKIRDRMNTAILLAQAPVVAVLLVLVFGAHVTEPITNENVASVGITIFLMSLAALWFGASNGVREIVGEWAVYQRERMVNLRILAYVASKFTVLGGLSIMQCSVLLLITYVGCDLHAPFPFLFLLFLSATVESQSGCSFRHWHELPKSQSGSCRLCSWQW